MNNFQLSLKKIHVILILFLISLWIFPVYAQSPITATVDRSQVSFGDIVVLTVVVRSDSLSAPAPDLPPLDGFDIVGTSSSNQISMVGTSITAEGRYQFQLRPMKSGTLTIPQISVSLNGQTVQTDPITIQVEDGGTSPAQTPGTAAPTAPVPENLHGQDFYVEAEVDNDTSFVGEQIVYTFRFYQGVNLLDQPSYDAPTFTGFLTRSQPKQTQSTTQSAGRTYRVTELHTVLFPTVAGEATIDPAVLTISGGFFGRSQILSTEPISLTVKPLPPNAPADFSGAVGDFTIEANVDSIVAKVNEPVTLNVTISGTGDLDALPDPVWADLPNWRAFESKATTNTGFQDGKLSGTRQYERVLVPTAAGKTSLPAIRYTYFDPTIGTYRTIQTAPISVTIAPASDEPPVPTIPAAGKQDVALRATDIRHIKAVPTTLNIEKTPITRAPWFWILWVLPALALTGDFFWRRRRQYLRKNVGLARKLRAHKQARTQLAAIRHQSEQPYAEIRKVLTGYLSDKLNCGIEGLTSTALDALLADSDVDNALVRRINAALSAADMGHFAPTTPRPEQLEDLFQTVETLIDELENVLE